MARIFILAVILFSSFSAVAQQVSIEYLKGPGRIQGARVAFQPWEVSLSNYEQFASSPFLQRLNFSFEASSNFWRYGQPAEYESNFAVALSPVFEFTFAQIGQVPVAFEAGIGLSVLNKRRFAGKDLGSYYQFEDRLGFVFKLTPQTKLTARYMHYSNGGLARHNPGMDFFNLAVAFAW